MTLEDFNECFSVDIKMAQGAPDYSEYADFDNTKAELTAKNVGNLVATLTVRSGREAYVRRILGLAENEALRSLRGSGRAGGCVTPARVLSRTPGGLTLACPDAAPGAAVLDAGGRYAGTVTSSDGDCCTAAVTSAAGLCGSCRYRTGAWQFTEAEMKKRINHLRGKIDRHGGLDILVTHAPMHGYGDLTDLPHRGFTAFSVLLDRYHPQLMLHGHIHLSYGASIPREQQYGTTRIVNCYERVYLDAEPPAVKPRHRLFASLLGRSAL